MLRNPDTKFTLGNDWILRSDPYYPSKKYSVYNIKNRIILYINAPCYTLLNILKRIPLSYNEIEEILSKKNIKFDWDGFEKICNSSQVTDLLINSTLPLKQINSFNDEYDFSYLNIPITSSPIDIELHFTHKCNLRCPHCFQDSSPTSQIYKELNINEWIKIFDQFEENKVQNVTISGGEPLFYKEFSNLFNILVKKKLNFSVLTNGTLVSKDNIESLSNPNVSLTISLDGCSEEMHDKIRGNGSFKRVITNIRALVEHGANVSLAYTINSYNYSYIKEAILLACNLGVEGIVFAFTDEIGRAKENSYLIISSSQRAKVIDEYKKIKREFKGSINLDFADLSFMKGFYSNLIYCAAGTTRATVNAEGKLYPCVTAFGYDEFIIGDLTKESLQDIWRKKEEWRLFRGAIKIEDLKECNICSLNKCCTQKNCRLKSYAINKSLYNKPLECPANYC